MPLSLDAFTNIDSLYLYFHINSPLDIHISAEMGLKHFLKYFYVTDIEKKFKVMANTSCSMFIILNYLYTLTHLFSYQAYR